MIIPRFGKTVLRSFFAALTMLTIIPIPGYSPHEDELAHAKPFFPIVGFIIGGIGYWLTTGIGHFAPPAITAGIIVVFLAGISQGFHLDGLADSADGFFSSRPRERMLEIMRDSHIGVMGVLALIMVLGLKTAGFLSTIKYDLPRVVLFTPIAGRCGLILHVFISKYARTEGLGEITFRYKSPFCLIWTLLCLFVSGYLLLGIKGIIIATAIVIFTLLWSFYTYRQINGATGDTLGAAVEICEMLVPVIFCCL